MAIQGGLVRQAAVIAVQNEQVCLVSSRSGRRWVVPKGCIEAGKSAGEIALQEAWEEAGLAGLLGKEPIGSYVYEKDGMVCHVIVFVMRVTTQVDAYPEASVRQRIWLSIPQALVRLEEHGLRELLRAVEFARLP